MAKRTVISDPELGDLTFDRLTRDVSIFQRAKGHRFSSDDIVTAYVAARLCPTPPERILDLGCGIGSVLLHLAWTFPDAALVGIEAQAVSFELLQRNVARNDLASRVTVHHGDLRDPESIAKLGRGFDLITGTPPYFPATAAIDATDEQRAYARIEYRGGIDAYIATAGALLGVNGVISVCGDTRTQARVDEAAGQATLHCVDICRIVSKEGEAPLFSVWSFARHPRPCHEHTMTLRTSSGETTPDARALRTFSGL